MLLVTRLFPFWALLVAVAAYLLPATFLPIGPWVTLLLALIMFAMGVILRVEDFRRVIVRPAPMLAGPGLHYLSMPLAAWGIARALALPPELATGMILVASVASGTASTVTMYLSGGDVALSVTISVLSTVVGVVATPLLARFYVSADIAVNVAGLLISIVQIVAVAPILAIIAAVVSGTQPSIAAVGSTVMLAVVLHNAIGLLGGRLLGFDKSVGRTLALEVGMQNSGLAAKLGRLCFSPLAALPEAPFSVWHTLSGSWLARFWAGHPAARRAAVARAA